MKDILRHLLATIYYRGMKYLSGYGRAFESFDPGEGVRSQAEILNHINKLLLFTKSFFTTDIKISLKQLDFAGEIERFKKSIRELDEFLDSPVEPHSTGYEQVIQGPVADMILHIGELSMLRRIAGDPADDNENYTKAAIEIGKFDA